MSEALSQVVDRLGSDLVFAAQFMDNPEVLHGMGLTDAEYNALAARSERDLMELGLDRASFSEVGSGAHSSTCG